MLSQVFLYPERGRQAHSYLAILLGQHLINQTDFPIYCWVNEYDVSCLSFVSLPFVSILMHTLNQYKRYLCELKSSCLDIY